MSKLLFEFIQNNQENHHLEVVRKQLYWCDEYLEIMCIGLRTTKKYLFRLSPALISVMIQKYYFHLNELWKLLLDSAQIYVDRVLFSIQHIQLFPLKKDSHRRDAYSIYRTNKFDEKGEPWNIEFLTNLVEPFDVEIQVQLSSYWDRRHYYRIESFLLKSHFERFCLEKYATSLIPPEQLKKGIDFSQYPKEPNYMLESLVEEIIFDKESDEIYVKSIEMLRLEEYLDRAVHKHHSTKAKQDFVLHQQTLEQKQQELEGNFSQQRQSLLVEGVTILQSKSHDQKEVEDNDHDAANDKHDEELIALPGQLTTTEPKPPPLDKYASLSNIAAEEFEKLKALTDVHRQRHAYRVNEKPEEKQEKENKKDANEDEMNQDGNIDPSTGAEALLAFERRRKERMSPFETFLLSHSTSPRRIKEMENKINQIYQENYHAILSTLDEMNVLINKPLESYKDHFQKQQTQQNSLTVSVAASSSPKDKQQRFLENSKQQQQQQQQQQQNQQKEIMSEAELKKFIVKEALSLKSETRSLLSTKIIMDYLKHNSSLGKYFTHCSIDDIQSIANDCILVEANENTILDTLQVIQHDPIDNIYLLISGELSAKAMPTVSPDGKTPPIPPAKQSPRDNASPDPVKKFKEERSKSVSDRQSRRIGSVLVGETWNFYEGDILGENVFTGGLVWEYTLQSPIPLVKEAKFQALGKSRRTLLYQPHSSKALDQEEPIPTILPPPQKQFILCKIPFISCQRYIGRSGPEVEDFLIYFWKSLRLYREILSYNEMIVQQSLTNVINKEVNPLQYELDCIKHQFYHHLLPMNVFSSGRIRTYQAGMEIFTQGKLRHHFFIMKQGSATYYRIFPKEMIGNDIIPEKIETVMNRNYTGTLLSNDFSFFDSEDITIIDKIEELDQQFLKMIASSLQQQKERDGEASSYAGPNGQQQEQKERKNAFLPPRSLFTLSNDTTNGKAIPLVSHSSSDEPEPAKNKRNSNDRTANQNEDDADDEQEDNKNTTTIEPITSTFTHYSNEKLFEYHQKKYHRFENYKNSLIANTRCEICVLEITEIVKSIQVFKHLIEITNQKYPQLLISNEEIIYDYYCEYFWKTSHRKQYLQMIANDRLANQLEETFHHEVLNNENDDLYRKRQPLTENRKEFFALSSKQQKQRKKEKGIFSRPATAISLQLPAPSRPSTTNSAFRQGRGKGSTDSEKEKEQLEKADWYKEEMMMGLMVDAEDAGEEERKQKKEYIIQQEMMKFQYPQKYAAMMKEIQQTSHQSDLLLQQLLASDHQHHHHNRNHHHQLPPQHPHKLAIKTSSYNSQKMTQLKPDQETLPLTPTHASAMIASSASPQRTVMIKSPPLKSQAEGKEIIEKSPSEVKEEIGQVTQPPSALFIGVSPSRPKSAIPSHPSSGRKRLTNRIKVQQPTSTDQMNPSNQSASIDPPKVLSISITPVKERGGVEESPATSTSPTSRRKAVDIQMKNIHDIRLETEKVRGFSPPSSSMTIGRENKSPLTMIDKLWQCHSPKASQPEGFTPGGKDPLQTPKRTPFNTDLLSPSQRRTPDDYVQLYRERVKDDPKQRFLDEFIHKKYV